MINVARYSALKAAGRVTLERVSKNPLLIIAKIKRSTVDEDGVVTTVEIVEEIKRAEYVAFRQGYVAITSECAAFLGDFDALRDAP